MAAFDEGGSQVELRISDSLRPVLPLLLRRLRAALDLDADPHAINSRLHASFPLGDGLRVPGSLSGYELAVRAVLGQQITVAAGGVASVDFRLKRAVKTKNAVSADFHIHSGRSFDTNAAVRDRVAAFAAEGIEVMISTDHDKHVDFGPHIASFGIGSFMTSVIGNEISGAVPNPPSLPNSIGHINAWPLAVAPNGKRDGAMLEATLLEGVGRDTKLNTEEAFGPVAFLVPFDSFDEALDIVNDSKFGLQAGIFTRDLFQTLDAWDRLDVGGVIINDVPSYRVDNMPYGGVKDSGLGREGVRFAMEDMTEIRNLVIRRRH